MGKTMPTPEFINFSQPLFSGKFNQVQRALQEMACRVEGLMLTAADIAPPIPNPGEFEIEQFVLVRSDQFNALLRAKPIQSAGLLQDQELTYQIDLTFEPEAIALFCRQLIDRLHSQPLICKTLEIGAVLPNDSQLQGEFTLRLIAALTASDSEPNSNWAPSSDPGLASTEAALRQQVKQEQLLNQVTTQIRQSLELPVILQTAVEQVRQFLQVDRLVIYQLDLPSALSSGAISGLGASVSEAASSSGSVVYEARISNAISSVLELSDAYCVAQEPRQQERQCWKHPFSVNDVRIKYATLPCLQNFLQQAQVRAKLVAPIWVRSCLWGLLIAHECFEPRQWKESEQQFLQQIAGHLAIAIEQAQLYIEVQQQKHTLEQRVIERTQELRDTLLAAQSANRAKSEFLATVSHELRTPLASIIGMSATLQRWTGNVLSERQQNFLQSIHDSGEHLLSLINDILDLSEAEAGKFVLNLSEFSLSLVVQQTLKAFEGQVDLDEIDLELDLRIDPQRDRFTADPRRVQQILFNLLGNAVKFTPRAGKVTLRVFAEEDLAIFQVKDTGIGIPESKRSLLFQKFQQLDTSYQRQYQGTGLGLALSKLLVELHGGSIEVESTEGVGSVFTVRLPKQRKTAQPAKTNSSLSSRSRGRIVLIEPHEETANLICDVLTAADYQLVWMLEGFTAMSQIETLRPAVVILNMQLPDIDGYSLIQNLRQNPTTKNLKVIAMTPVSVENPSEPYEALGADAWVVQPIQPEHLLRKVAALVNAAMGA
jgi:two-component system sensor histidine kinase/response regulator